MASSGSKKSKTKWKTVDASQILDSKAPRKVTSSWADDSNNDLDDTYDYGRKTDLNNIVLPTAPRAARGPENDANIPKEPPFQLYLSNLAYEVTEDELSDFFSKLRVKSVRLPKDERGNGTRSKGYGYVEFEDRESLIEALSIPDTTFKNRRMRIEVAEGDQGRGGRGGMRERGPNEPDRTLGDWRSGPRSEPEPSDRDGYRSGPRRDYNNSEGGMFGDRDRRGGGGGFRDDDRGGFRSRDGYRDNRSGGFGRDDRGGGGFRDDRGGSGFRDRGGDRGGFRDGGNDRFERRGYDDKRSDFGGGGGGGSGGGSWRRDPEPRQEREHDDRGREEIAPAGEPKTRTRLNLQPRSRPVEETVKEETRSTPAPTAASIFGGAKPVDTAAREREIEDRLNKQRENVPRDENKSGLRDSALSNKESAPSRDEPPTPSLEPAPPPRENPWAKRPNTQVNNGRVSPHEDGETHKRRGTSPSNEPRKYQPPRRISQDDRRRDERGGSGPVRGGSRGGGARQIDSKPPAQPTKPREQKKETDESLRMPKFQEHQAPNFIGSNKYAYLEDSESAVD